MTGEPESTTMDEARETAAPLLPLYLANAVCSMGMMGFVAVAGPLAEAIGLEAWQIGISATAGGLGWVLAARFWGHTADRIGRKPVLVVGLIGFSLAYIALCLGAQAGIGWGLAPLAALSALVATRFCMGLAYSAVPAAGNAMIADRYAPDARAGAMGRLGAAQAAGLLFGPAFVAIAAGPSPTTPLFILAILPLPVLAFVAARLPRSPSRDGKVTQPLALSDPRLLRPVLAAFAVMIAVGTAQIIIGFIALDRLGLPGPAAVRFAGFALSAVGVALIVAQMVVARLGWPPHTLMRAGGAIAAIGFAAAAFAPDGLTLAAAYALAGFGAGWAFPAISAAAANAVSADEQGRAAGSVSSAFGLGAICGPVLGGVLYDVAAALPLLAGALAMLAVTFLARVQRPMPGS